MYRYGNAYASTALEPARVSVCRKLPRFSTRRPHAAFAQQFEPQGLPPTPLLNFSRLFVAAVEREDYVLYTMLLDEYRPALSRDPSFFQFAGHIGEVWFGVPHKKGGGGLMGMLSDFMS